MPYICEVLVTDLIPGVSLGTHGSQVDQIGNGSPAVPLGVKGQLSQILLCYVICHCTPSFVQVRLHDTGTVNLILIDRLPRTAGHATHQQQCLLPCFLQQRSIQPVRRNFKVWQHAGHSIGKLHIQMSLCQSLQEYVAASRPRSVAKTILRRIAALHCF